MRFLFAVAVAVSITGSIAAQPAPPSRLSAQLVLSSPYIFRGTVIPSLVRGGDANRVTVRVDEIYRGAASVGDFTGQQIVVERKASSDRREALFFTTPVSWGKTVAVRELDELAVPSDAPSIRKQIVAIEQDEVDRAFVERLRSAEAVVAGRVIDVVPIEQKERHSSEHDPDWRVARVAVTQVLAGNPATRDCGAPAKCVNVAFAASIDVMWVASPKLAKDDEAILLLRRDDPRAVRGKPPVEVYLLVDRADRVRRSEEERVRRLLSRIR